jgi:hypothetical protein
MNTCTQRLVVYSLLAGPWALVATQQLLSSVAGLRAHNARVAVRVFVFGGLAPEARAALQAHRVVVEDAGDYQAALAPLCSASGAEVFARLPVLHYALALARLDLPEDAQVLYLDNDTHLFRDVEDLFERHRELDVYAREEPGSRRSHLGYDPRLVDEDALGILAAGVGARPVVPFNNGVMLFNHGAWAKLARRLPELLRLTFRFSVALARSPGSEDQPDIVYLRRERARLVDRRDEAEALPCPTENVWIKDEIALWLALGRAPALRVGLFSRHDVLQGDEFERVDLSGHVLAHYFSRNMARFDAWLARRNEASPAPSPRAEPSAGLLFDALGARIEEAWQRLDYDERAFPAIASAALREARLDERTSSMEVLRWLLEASRIPPQDDIAAKFGDPPITVHHGRRFFIQVLLWHEGSTAIHRHGFDGAFTVLEGSTLHARYTYEPRRRVSSRFLLGDLRLVDAGLVERGEVVPITWDLIHAAFHLRSPAATVVVRTYTNDEAQPQYNYLPPGLAYDPFFVEPHARRRVQAMHFLWRTSPAAAMDLAVDLASRTDLHACWEVLLQAYRTLGAEAPAAPLLAAARRRHGAVVDELAAALHEDLRRRALCRLASSVKDPDERFFLALLENLPSRAAIEELVRRRYPDADPRQRVRAWLDALSGVERIGLDLGDDLSRHVVHSLLDGRSTDGALEALKEVFEPAQIEAERDRLVRHVDRARATALAPLFR